MCVLTGCWGVTPLEKAGLVSLLGIDREPSGGYLVTADLVSPESIPAPSPSGGGAMSGVPVAVQEGAGSTVYAALQALNARSPLAPDYSHLQGVIVSQEVARSGLGAPFDALVRSPDISEVAPWLLIAKDGTAASVLRDSEHVVPYAGDVLKDAATRSLAYSPYQPSHVWDFLKQMGRPGDEPVAAGVVVVGSGQSASFRMVGLGMFRGGALVGWLGRDAAVGWMLLAGRVRAQTVTVPSRNGGVYTVELMGVRRHLRVVRALGVTHVEVDLTVTSEVSSADGAPSNFAGDQHLTRSVDRATEVVLRNDVLSAVEAARAVHSDVLGLGEYVRVQDPSAWRTVSGEWSTVGVSGLRVAPRVTVHLASVGLTVCPLVGLCG